MSGVIDNKDPAKGLTIVKVQRPINGDHHPWLIYDKDRKYWKMVPPEHIPSSVRRMLGGDNKGYFEAVWIEAADPVPAYWELGPRTKNQEW